MMFLERGVFGLSEAGEHPGWGENKQHEKDEEDEDENEDEKRKRKRKSKKKKKKHSKKHSKDKNLGQLQTISL
ncbi:uncharacterized protein MAM_03822 [Metarhizium album ARSEF 1941]|uniref:Uncharacterized protein n=1 Tax=Metarhizium album (strain ARSEF 1941) TaxID=1081103 RepID=A0A0B2WPU0_METAS|nr:uncharacterized protein MAM_03822 [Metarhizium album ARSEF 1941]KHN98061.1 hypothetical protein MAM_03822 [Metarhizium album ARSEF 1941]